MKKLKKTEMIKRLLFSAAILIWLTEGLNCSAVTPGRTVQKTYTWNYKINTDARVQTSNYDCDLTIHTWDKPEAEYRLIVDAETRSDDDAAALDKYLNEMTFNHSSANVSFDNRFWETRNNILGRMTMKLKNGKSISLSSFDMKGELWIPKGCTFSFSSKYSEINMDDFAGQASFDLYNDNLYAGNMGAAIEVTDKYGTIEFKDVKDIRADLYNSRLDGENCGNLIAESKYSKVTFKTSGDLKIDGYNDKYSFDKTGDVSITAKYTDFKSEASGKADVDYYEGTFSTGTVKDISINSKYADYRFDVAENIKISSSYNDRFTAAKTTSLSIAESKYCSYKVDELAESLTENDGYNDKFVVSVTGSSFSGIKVNGKYLDISLSLPKNLDYRFKANITYADLDINESSFKPIVKVVKNSQVEYDAVKGTEKEGMPVVEADGYQVSLKIVNQ